MRIRFDRPLLVLGAVAGLVMACGVTGDEELPTGVQDPTAIQTPAGTMAYYQGTFEVLASAFDEVVVTGGVLTDELVALWSPPGVVHNVLDGRHDLTPSDAADHSRKVGLTLYDFLHKLRAQSRDVRGFLGAYLPDTGGAASKDALTGHMYALEGYAVVFLADLFCSGIPLSTVDFGRDYTLSPPIGTPDAYDRAAELFDSALALTADDVAFRHLAAVGKGRALLGRGDYAGAAAAVAAVPDDYAYRVTKSSEHGRLFWFRSEYTPGVGGVPGLPHMAEREGVHGLEYRSSGDPRTAWLLMGKDVYDNDIYFPAKYPPNGGITYAMADGVEARLIEAEAALAAGDAAGWLGKLTGLRQSAAACGTIVPATTCPLPPLDDPGASIADPEDAHDARVDLLFRERAFWLYLTGHRQGDLRRLVRQYGRAPNDVYPTGLGYPGGTGEYGNEVVIPVPDDERRYNPKYTGCINRSA